MEFSGAIYCGFAAANSKSKSVQCLEGHVSVHYEPFTASHKVGIVGSHSYNEMVKPGAIVSGEMME